MEKRKMPGNVHEARVAFPPGLTSYYMRRLISERRELGVGG